MLLSYYINIKYELRLFLIHMFDKMRCFYWVHNNSKEEDIIQLFTASALEMKQQNFVEVDSVFILTIARINR